VLAFGVESVIDEGDVFELSSRAFVEHAEVVCLLDACFLVEDQLGVEDVVKTELVEQESYRAGVFGGRNRRQGAILVFSQRIGETGEREMEPQPSPDVSLSEIASALVEAVVKPVKPRLPDLAVERVVGLLVVDGDVVLDGLAWSRRGTSCPRRAESGSRAA